MQKKQQTLASTITFSGKGLHTGAIVTMTINPAAENHGIVFRRTDIEGAPTVPALCEYVTDTSRGTTIEKLCRMNNIKRTSVLRPGQILRYS